MVKLVALYTTPPDPETFDRHYRETHLPLIERWPGLHRIEVGKVTGALGGSPPYYLVAEMYFDDGRCGQSAILDASDEAVAAARQSLDVAGFLG